MFGGEVSDAEEENLVGMKVRYGWTPVGTR